MLCTHAHTHIDIDAQVHERAHANNTHICTYAHVNTHAHEYTHRSAHTHACAPHTLIKINL